MYALKNIRKTDLQTLLNDLHDNGYAKNSIIEVKGILTKCFAYAVNESYLSASPATGLKTPKTEFTKIPTRSAPHSYIEKEKIDIILNRFSEGTSGFIPLLLGYRCGLRSGETFALLWEDIDFSEKTLTVKRQIQWMQNDRSDEEKHQTNGMKNDEAGYWYFSTPKYNSVRTIDLDDELITILSNEKQRQESAQMNYTESYVKYYSDEHRRINSAGRGEKLNFVCISEDGSYINSRTLNHVSSVIRKELHIPEFTYHSLRHTHTTMLIENGAPIKYVQTRLGHKNIDITLNVYRHYTKAIAEQGCGILNSTF